MPGLGGIEGWAGLVLTAPALQRVGVSPFLYSVVAALLGMIYIPLQGLT